MNAFFSARTVLLAKAKVITHLLTYATTFSARHLMSQNAKAWKLQRAVLQNEEPYQANT